MKEILKIDEFESYVAEALEVIPEEPLEGELPVVVFPSFVKRVDSAGNYVYAEMTQDLPFVKLVLTKYLNADEDINTMSEEEFLSHSGFNYYESVVDGSYIGTTDVFNALKYKGIIYMEGIDGSSVACIGLSEDGKWYGWSQYTIHGFGIGDVVQEGDLTTTSGYTDDYVIQHPEDDKSLPVGFTAYTMNDAKRMAIAYASAV